MRFAPSLVSSPILHLVFYLARWLWLVCCPLNIAFWQCANYSNWILFHFVYTIVCLMQHLLWRLMSTVFKRQTAGQQHCTAICRCLCKPSVDIFNGFFYNSFVFSCLMALDLVVQSFLWPWSLLWIIRNHLHSLCLNSSLSRAHTTNKFKIDGREHSRLFKF